MLIPKNQDRKNKGTRPKWLNVDKIKKHAKRSTSVSAKAKELLERQSKPQVKEIVLSYMCSQCKKSFSTESLRKQLIEAARRADTYVSCPKCGVALVADRKTKVPIKLSRKVRRTAELTSVYSNQGITPGYVPSSWTDRAILEKIAHELGKFAASVGMFSPQLKFQGGIRGKVREGAPENVKFAEYTIESTDSNDIRFRVLAIAGITPAGKVLLPKTFKTLMGKEISFTEAGVQEFVSGKVFEPAEPKFVTPKLYYRDPDPTRFREIVASIKKAQVDFEDAPEGVERVHPGTEEWQNIVNTFVGDYVSDVKEGVLLNESTIMESVAGYEVDKYVNFGDDINSMVDNILTALRTKGIRIVEGKKKTAAGTPTPGQTVMYQEKEYTVDSITGDASVLTDEAGVLTAPIPNADLNIQMGEGLEAPVAPTASVKDKIGNLVKKSLRDEKTLVPFTDPKPDYSVAEQSKVDADFSVPYEESDQGILDEKDRAVQRMFRGGTSIKPTKSAAEIRWQKVMDDLNRDIDDAGSVADWMFNHGAEVIENALMDWVSEHDLVLSSEEFADLNVSVMDRKADEEGEERTASIKKTAPEKAELERMVRKCMKEKGWSHDKCMSYVAGGIWHRKGKNASLHPGMYGVTNDGFKFTILEVMGNEIEIWEEETDASRVVNKTEWETEKSPEYGGSKEIEASLKKTAEPTGYHETDETGKVIELSRLRKLIEDYARAGQFPPDFDLTKVMSEVSRMTRKDLLEILDKKLKDTHFPVVHARKKTASRGDFDFIEPQDLPNGWTIQARGWSENMVVFYMIEVYQTGSDGEKGYDLLWSSKEVDEDNEGAVNAVETQARKMFEQYKEEVSKYEPPSGFQYKMKLSKKTTKGKSTNDIVRKIRKADLTEEDVKEDIKDEEEGAKTYKEQAKEVDSEKAEKVLEKAAEDELKHAEELEEVVLPTVKNTEHFIKIHNLRKKKAQEEEEEKPVTEFKELKTKPHGKPTPGEVKEAPTATPEMQKTFNEVQSHKQRIAEIKSVITDARQKLEEQIRKIQTEQGSVEEAAQMKEGIEKLAVLIEQAESQVVDFGERLAFLDTSLKTKKFRPSDKWRVVKLLEKFGEEAKNYLEKAELGASSLNEEIQSRVLTVFPKREGTIKKADVFDAITELGKSLWSYVKSLAEITSESEQLELAL